MKSTYPKLNLLAILLLLTGTGLFFTACEEDEKAQPVIESYSPESAAPGTNVSISGLHFSADATVKFNGLDATVVSATSTQILATVPATATSGKITVTSAGMIATSANDFTVFQTISDFAPTSGVIGSTVTINGRNFDPVAANNIVKFNGIIASVTAVSATQLTATVPLSATTGEISVTVNGTTATTSGTFTILAPSITEISPSSATIGTNIVIQGANFSAVPTENVVKFNGVDAGAVLTATTTQLTVTVPANATTGKITVTTNGVTGTSINDFIILDPSISDFSPSVGAIGTTVTIHGFNFSTTPSQNVIKFNNIDAGTAITATPTTLTVVVPANATTGKITVIAAGKTCVSESDFVIAVPTISSFFPSIASTGRTVLISGQNFSPVAANNMVKFNGVDATVTAASSTELVVTVPVQASNGRISVEIGNLSSTSQTDFEVCVGSSEIVISNISITNGSTSSSYFIKFTITNTGSVDANASKLVMQNYASADAAVGNDLGASGYALTNAGVLAPGQSYTTPYMGCGIGGGTKTSHPYLILTLFDSPDGSVTECNTTNNVVITTFN